MKYKVSMLELSWVEVEVEADRPSLALTEALAGKGQIVEMDPEMNIAAMRASVHDGDGRFPVEYYALVEDDTGAVVYEAESEYEV